MAKKIKNILSLDQGNVTGFACKTDSRVTFGHRDFNAYIDIPARWFSFHGWFSDLLSETKPDLVTYEQPFFRGKNSLALYGYVVHLETICFIYDTKCKKVNGSAIKKHAGVAPNEKPVAQAEKKWGHIQPVQNDHEADALWLMDYTAVHYQYKDKEDV